MISTGKLDFFFKGQSLKPFVILDISLPGIYIRVILLKEIMFSSYVRGLNSLLQITMYSLNALINFFFFIDDRRFSLAILTPGASLELL